MDPAVAVHQMLAGTGELGYLQFRFRYDGTDLPPEHPFFSPPTWCGPTFARADMRPRILRLFTMDDCSVGAVPRRRPEDGFMAGSNVLWARLETAKHAEALARFRPAPSVVLREGKSPRRTALWALSDPLSIDWLERANRRIAHRLGCKKKWAEHTFDLHPPGTTLHLGARPARVWAEHLDHGALFTARGVVGGLQDAPDPDAWRKAA